eukprot:XP_027311119.1 actin-related protein 6 [Anas platyrhynchos]
MATAAPCCPKGTKQEMLTDINTVLWEFIQNNDFKKNDGCSPWRGAHAGAGAWGGRCPPVWDRCWSSLLLGTDPPLGGAAATQPQRAPDPSLPPAAASGRGGGAVPAARLRPGRQRARAAPPLYGNHRDPRRWRINTGTAAAVAPWGAWPRWCWITAPTPPRSATATPTSDRPLGPLLHPPFQKGYLVNWDVQRQVWDYLFGKEMYQVDFVDTNIIITEPYFNFSSIQESMNEILFEEYQFQAVLRVNAGALSAHRYFRDNPSELCCIIVDSGYSFTHIVPYCRSKKKKEAIIRINVGGKLLTNHLKEIISYRQLHVMDETHVINQVKEDVCYVSQDFYKDMEIAKLKGEENTVMVDYVLPDFSTIKKGFCKPREEMVLSGKYKTGEQILRLTNERFAVPEILFHPSDIGIQEMGIPEAIVDSIQNLPEEMQPHFFKNIVLTGGNTLFPGFRDRVYSEVRCLTPTDYDVSVVLPENPITYSWEGGKLISENDDFEDMVVTREDYEEHGHNICEEKFDI